MLIGVDVSHHNGAVLDLLAGHHIDFVIAKATEGITFKDSKFDGNMQSAKLFNLLKGAYHYVNTEPQYMNEFRAYQEAKHFVSYVRPYGDCLLALDFEEKHMLSQQGVNYLGGVAQFVKDMTGTPPLIYASESVIKQFDFTPCIKVGCGLWAAKWKKNVCPEIEHLSKDDYVSASAKQFGVVAIQQISSKAKIGGVEYNLDVDIANMNMTAWHKYANPRL